MEKLQKRLRAFIVLAILSGVAAVVYVAAVKPAKAAEADATPLPITVQDLGLNQAPPISGLAAWWSDIKDRIRAQFTFSAPKRAELQIEQISKTLWRVKETSGQTNINNLLVKYRAQLNKLVDTLQKNNDPQWTEVKQRFASIILTHQALFNELADQNQEVKDQINQTKQTNWDKLTAALGNLAPDDFKALLEKLNLPSNIQKLRTAVLFQEWRATLPDDKQQQLTDATQNIIDQLKSLSAGEAGNLAEALSRLTANSTIQTTIAQLLEKIQPSLQGLVKQLEQTQPPGQKPQIPLINTGPALNVNITPLTNDQLLKYQHDLADATTKDELLALRQKWYNNQLLYAQLTKYHSDLLNQLNAKLQKALGKAPKPVTLPNSATPSNEKPLPLQQLTPEQQAAADSYLQQLNQQYPDLPPPNNGQ